MGIFKEETHDSSSSSMTYATRWKHESLSKISVAAIALIAITLTVLLFVSIQERKQVYLVIDGHVSAVETHHAMLQEMLNEQAVMLRPEDKVSVSLNSSLKDGDKVHIQRAVEINVTADGQSVTRFITQGTVKDAVKQLGITLDVHDKVFPELNTKITDKLDIKVVRINKQIVERVEAIPFRVIKTSDPTIVKGNVKVVQNGQSGAIVQQIEKIYQDGQFVTMSLVGQVVKSQVQDQIVAVGTKVEQPKPIVLASTVASNKTSKKAKVTNVSKENNQASKAGVDFKYKKVLKNVSMTAYSSEEPGIGTRTASGTRVTEGRTIAVDTSVIPMGWWVYIEGIGFRRAEDTGGAIKGNKIDVYYDSLQNARNFGRKNGRTIYVIGPVKPELN
ncbi:ubiquitin-like domain-containing protein [Paenibacillus sp. FA6]|uniref:ubiquitin-like domain-containing protein n=1 Tax=Paenibacillus sp. FA6 TaxID=3413029 RepID=UPI003F65DB93